MTTGSNSSNTVVETVNGWNYHLIQTKVWSGGDSPSTYAKPPKVYVPVFQPEVKRWRNVRVSDTSLLKKRVRYLDRRTGAFKYRDVLVPAHRRGYYYHRSLVVTKPPRFYQKRSFPQIPRRSVAYEPHPYTMAAMTVREDWFTARRNGSGLYSGIIGEQLGQGSDFIWDPEDDLKLVDKLKEAVSGSSFHGGKFLGESRKSLSLITSAAVRLHRSYRLFKSGSLPAAVKVLSGSAPSRRELKLKTKDPAQAHLEYIYGVRPLLKDVEEAARFMGYTSAAPRSDTVTVTRYGGGKKYFTVKKQVWGFTPSSIAFVDVGIVESKRLKCRYSEVDLVSLSGLLDPAGVAFELLPLSFVADWFYPLGSYLDALNTVRSITGQYVISHRKVSRAGSLYIENTSSDLFVLERRPVNHISTQITLSRTVTNSVPLPAPRTLRKASKALTFDHAIAAIALVVANFGR